MIKIARLFEYFYLVVAVFFTYEAITKWNTERDQAYIFLFFVVIAIFMFFFRRRFRRNVENRMKDQDSDRN